MSSRTLLCLLLLTGSGTGYARAGDMVWVEAEQFEQLGGWVNDAQFVDQMGSPYLLAAGIGQPVADAVAHVEIPRAGRWRLWVRVRDWRPEHHPGRFQLLLNGKAAGLIGSVGPAFGASGKPGWRWEDGGAHELSGRVELRLHDLTGYYGRCDAIVLSEELAWTPPEQKQAIEALRIAHGGLSRQVREFGPCDVVVVGGGLAGCTAAVAAARGGAQVELLQDRPVLGGNASPEILVPPVGVWPSKVGPLDPRETGLVEEYRTEGNQRVSEGMLYTERLLRWVKLEPNLDLHLNTRAVAVEMQPGASTRIASVLAVDVNTGQRMRFAGKIFADCTGDAVIGVAAGAEYRQGKESKSMHDERWAPVAASSNTMGNGLKYFHQDAGTPQPFTAPPWAFPFPTCDSFAPGRHPDFITRTDALGNQWKIELGGLQDTYADAEEIRDDLLRLIFGLWDHTKNHCAKDKERAATHKLVWVGHVAGKRENRRLIGDYILTQNDIEAQTQFPDRVAYGGWSVDDHYSAGFFHKGSTGQYTEDWDHAFLGRPFSIPFRSLYSKNIENLLMAGRDISATHLGLSDTRVMLTCAVIGQAAGAGAALCVAHHTTPRGVCQNHLEDLQQQLLKDGAYLINLKNRDPRDLARQAKTSASSQGTHEGRPMEAASVTGGRARAENGKPNAWAPDPKATGPHWIELAWPGPQTFNVVHVVFQTAKLAPKRFSLQAWQAGAWKPLADVADNRHRRHVLGLERVTTLRLRLVLDEPRGVCQIRVYDEPQGTVEIARRAWRNMRQPDQGPWLPWDLDEPPRRE